MLTRNGSPLTWTVDNLPASLGSSQGSSTFSYGPDRARYQQTATYNGSTATTTYIGGLFEVVASATTTDYRHNIIADGQVIAVHTIDENGNATTSYLHYDHLGSVDTITDDQGAIAQTMSFDAFGLRRDATNWDYDLTTAQITALKDDTDRGFTFQEQLDNVGLVHMNGRVYDPSIGRFISGDPIEGGNRYAYVDDSPLDYTDPSGFVCRSGNGTEACQEMDGGSGGYISGGGTGDAGADSPSGGDGGGGQQNDAHIPQTQTIQAQSDPQLGKVTVNCDAVCQALAWEYSLINTSWMDLIFSYTNPSASQNGGPQGSGGGPNSKQSNSGAGPQNKQENSKACSAPGHGNALNFVNSNQTVASGIANQLATPVGNILGLAGFESGWGTGPLIVAGTNNYFSLTALPNGGGAFANGANGTYQQGTHLFETYPGSGMQASGDAFAASYVGDLVFATTTPQEFASALNSSGNYDNLNPEYNSTLVNVINLVNELIGCH